MSSSPQPRPGFRSPLTRASAELPAEPAWFKALVIAAAAIVLFLALTPIWPDLYWDTDPRLIESPGNHSAIGPTISMAITGVSLLLAGLLLAGHRLLGGRLSRIELALASLGMAAAWLQTLRQVDNAHFTGHWIAAVALAVALSHAASRPWVRRFLLASILALAAPFALRALSYVVIEHSSMLAGFQLREAAFLQSKGWDEGSAMHQMFIRRMEQNDAVGPFGFSNIFGSLAGAIALAAAVYASALAMIRWRRQLPVVNAGVMLACLAAALGLLTLALTKSKGAVVGCIAAASLVIVVLPLARRWHRPSLLAAATLLLVIAAALAPLARATLGPAPTAGGERSLLFRYHYQQGAAAAWNHAEPGDRIVGLGPAKFRQTYPIYKPADSPEDIQSTHAVFTDHVILLGVGGVAWCALLLIWLMRASRRAGIASAPEVTPSPSPASSGPPANSSIRELRTAAVGPAPAAAMLALVFLPNLLVGGRSLLIPASFLFWAIGAIFFFIIVAYFPLALSQRQLDSPPRADNNNNNNNNNNDDNRDHDELQAQAHADIASSDRAPIAAALFAGAAVLLIHNQIEMTFFNPGSAMLAWFIVAIAGAASAPTSTSASTTPTPDANTHPDTNGNDTASTNASPPNRSTRSPAEKPVVPIAIAGATLVVTFAWIVTVAWPVQRYEAAMSDAADDLRAGSASHLLVALDRAIEISPATPAPRRAKAERFLEWSREAAAVGRRPQAIELAQRGLNTIKAATDSGVNEAGLWRLRANLEDMIYRIRRDPAALAAAIASRQQAAKLRPHAWEDRILLGHLLEAANRSDKARQAWREAIDASDAAYLDPMRQMSAQQRASLVALIEPSGDTNNTNNP